MPAICQAANIFCLPSKLQDALAGRIPGLQVINGRPGEAANIRIRGMNYDNRNNTPLYVVDGVLLDGALVNIFFNLRKL